MITSQGMVSHLIFWLVQFPILLIPPHKLKWFFIAKVVLVIVCSVAMVISMTHQAGGAGDLWNLPYAVPAGPTRSWLILSSLSSITGGWATMAGECTCDSRGGSRPRRYASWSTWLGKVLTSY
jgi:nucleobase:cation symporter-1, NCS1 family